jgi:hypothetical protein
LREHEAHAEEAHLLQLFQRAERGAAALDQVHDQRRRKLGADASQLRPGAGPLDEEQRRAGLLVEPGAPDRLVEAVGLEGVGAGRDREGRVAARVHRGADLGSVLLGGDHLLATHVAAALGPALILEQHPPRAHGQQLAHHALHVERTAVARVAVDDDADLQRRHHAARGVQHLGLREEPDVGLAEVRGGEAVAGEHHGRKAGALRDLRGEHVVDAGHHQQAAGGDEGMNGFGAGRHRSSFQRGCGGIADP